jgi:hypothetical protein
MFMFRTGTLVQLADGRKKKHLSLQPLALALDPCSSHRLTVWPDKSSSINAPTAHDATLPMFLRTARTIEPASVICATDRGTISSLPDARAFFT